jgi:hypothetical protein
MHRDAICSAALRVAIEFLTTLPLDGVEVLMLTDVLDAATSTGRRCSTSGLQSGRSGRWISAGPTHARWLSALADTCRGAGATASRPPVQLGEMMGNRPS